MKKHFRSILALVTCLLTLNSRAQDYFFPLQIIADQQNKQVVVNKVSTATYNYKNKRHFVFEYDTLGRITKEKTILQGASGPQSWRAYTYNEKGQQLSSTSYGVENNDTTWTIWERKYNDQGFQVYRCIRNKGWDPHEEFTRRYFDKTFNANCIVTTRKTGSDSVYQRTDSTQAMVKNTWFRGDKSLQYIITRKYDQQGRMTLRTFTDNKGNTDRYTWKYEDGKVIQEKYIEEPGKKNGQPLIKVYDRKVYTVAQGKVETESTTDKGKPYTVHEQLEFLPNGLVSRIKKEGEIQYEVSYSYRE